MLHELLLSLLGHHGDFIVPRRATLPRPLSRHEALLRLAAATAAPGAATPADPTTRPSELLSFTVGFAVAPEADFLSPAEHQVTEELAELGFLYARLRAFVARHGRPGESRPSDGAPSELRPGAQTWEGGGRRERGGQDRTGGRSVVAVEGAPARALHGGRADPGVGAGAGWDVEADAEVWNREEEWDGGESELLALNEDVTSAAAEHLYAQAQDVTAGVTGATGGGVTPSLYLAAACEGLDAALEEYRAAVLQLEANALTDGTGVTNVTSGAACAVSLLDVRAALHPYLSLLPVLHDVTEALVPPALPLALVRAYAALSASSSSSSAPTLPPLVPPARPAPPRGGQVLQVLHRFAANGTDRPLSFFPSSRARAG